MQTLSSSELIARLTLHGLPKIGSKRFQQLISYFGSAEQALASPQLWHKAGLAGGCQTIVINTIAPLVEVTIKWLENDQHYLLCWDSPHYPALLREISDPPPLLFAMGDISILNNPQVAIVGSRHASKPGLETSFQFAKTLAETGFTITSGLALGIDGAAHQGALAGQGLTVAVLGCGLQHMYPTSHKQLASQIVSSRGVIISEFPLTTAPQAANFPRRNRIISGLTLGTLVVEATLGSGSLITAKLAAEQGREVFAIPGSIHHPAARGCHQLIREGALLVEEVSHILEAFKGWQNISSSEPTLSEELVTSSVHGIVQTLRASPQTSEALAVSLDIPFEQVLVELTELELMGKISCEAGLWYVL